MSRNRNSKDPRVRAGAGNVMTNKEINEKMYQVVDLKNGTYLVKRYNGTKAEQRYTHLGYFKLIEKSVKDCLHTHDVQTRKVDGHKTIRRAKSDVLTKLHSILPLLESEYVFYPLENVNMSEFEISLVQQYCDELNEKFKAEKITAELEALVSILRDLSHVAKNKVFTKTQDEHFRTVQIYVRNLCQAKV